MCARSFRWLPVVVVTLAIACSDSGSSSTAADGVSDAGASNATGARDAETGGLSDTTPAADAGADDTGLADTPDGDAEATDTAPTPDTEADDAVSDADDVCVALSASAENVLLPVDIVWIIDASPSMDVEIATIEANLNRFAMRIAESSLDYRVVLIGSDSDYCGEAQCYLEICVPPPLSAADTCPDQDSDRYLHVRRGVHSRDGLDVAMDSYSEWSGFLRPEAIKHMVMVTDDNVGFGADDADFTEFMERNAERLGSVRFHSVVDLIGYQPGCGVFDDEPCSCGEERGQAYINLSEQTGGLVQSICQEDWEPIFAALEQEVSEGTTLPCAFVLPAPEDGQALNPAEVNVVLTSEDGADRSTVPQVSVEADCALADGWYYDDRDAPTTILLCPNICNAPGRVEVELGCETVKY